MTQETVDIDAVEIMNDDLIDLLTSLREYDRTQGASGSNPEIAIEAPHGSQIGFADPYKGIDECRFSISAKSLVDGSELADTVTIDDSDVDLRVL